MPSCIVNGCKQHTSTKSSNPLLRMHAFPREIGRIKLWLQQTGQDFGELDAFAAKVLDSARNGKYRICSAHFQPGSYMKVGQRLVLKYDAVPTVFPGVYPKPSPDWQLIRKPHLGPDAIAKCPSGFYIAAPRPGFLRKDAATQTAAQSDKPRPLCHNTTLMERCNKEEEIFDANGRLIGLFSPDSRQRDPKVRPGLWTYDWSTQIPAETVTKNVVMENKKALSALEKVLFSLLKHMAESPRSGAQKQRTTRLLNRFAEIISVLTGEEWSVLKRNSHISKFYKAIREVPVKVGDVAMFFTMDEWTYIEENDGRYRAAMLENPPPHTAGKLTICTKEERDTDSSFPGNSAADNLESCLKKDDDLTNPGQEQSTAPVCKRSEKVRDCSRLGISEVFISQDGSSFSSWTSEKYPRPPGWSQKMYSRKPRPGQSPDEPISDTTTVSCLQSNHIKLKRLVAASNQRQESLTEQHEGVAQSMHSKKQRLSH